MGREGREWGSTGLHGHEAGPGVVGAAVAEPGDETACYDGDVCVREGDLVGEVAARGLECGLARLGDGAVGGAVFCCGESGLGLFLAGRSLHHCDGRS